MSQEFVTTRRLADVLRGAAVAVSVEQFSADESSALAYRRLRACRLLQHQQLDLSFDQLELSDEKFSFSAAQRLFLNLLVHQCPVQIFLASF